MSELIQKEWDYTKHAQFYSYRPNYADDAIDVLVAWSKGAKIVADIGAGTGNLGIMLAARGLDVIEIEPNDAMREIGQERLKNAKWIKANGVQTTLSDKSVDWVTFGSSFNVLDRELALKEAYRILKDGGKLSAMWNHRDLNDPIQNVAQEIIKDFIPSYNGGARREDQRPIFESSELFGDIFYIEQDFIFTQSLENYILAWKSVKNNFWDLNTEAGKKLFESICEKWRSKLPKTLNIRYTTRAWNVTKK